MNSNIIKLNATLAKDMFLGACHRHALMSTKPGVTVGKTVNTMLKKLETNAINRKRMVKKRKLVYNDTKTYNSVRAIHKKRRTLTIPKKKKKVQVKKRKLLATSHTMKPLNDDISEFPLEVAAENSLSDNREITFTQKNKRETLSKGMDVCSSNFATTKKTEALCNDVIIEPKNYTDMLKQYQQKKNFQFRVRKKLSVYGRNVGDGDDNDSSAKKNKSSSDTKPDIEKIIPEIMLRNGALLTRRDKLSVTEENTCLEQNIVTSFLSCFEEKDILVFGDNEWNLLKSGKHPRPSANLDWKVIKKVLVAKHDDKRSHFVLYYFEMNTRKLYYFDTIKISKDFRQKITCGILEVWDAFMLTVSSNNYKKFTVAVAPPDGSHPLQNDSTSCGVLVCMMGENIAIDRPVSFIKSDARSVTRYRHHIWETLCQNKDTERCSCCREKTDGRNHSGMEDRWIECSGCSLWYHFGCANIAYPNTDNEAVDNAVIQELHWMCHYCEN